ncbi:MAG TPA: glycine cleavage T C-terminal barrel domain-containing protein [Bryobacteraceae bacterium]
MSEGYEALRRGAAWFDVTARGRLRVTGRDRARLLHNVTTNEVKQLAPGSGCYAFLLTPQGRIQADLNLFCFTDHFFIDTEPELRETVPRLILKYKVADHVEVEDISGTTWAIAIEGPGAVEALSAAGMPAPSEPYSHVPWGECTVANISETAQPGFRIFVPASHPRPTLDAITLASEADVRQVRIENGRPRFGEDIRETTLPQETGQMHAVNFQKGCYIGQEIVERIRAQGHVNKHLVRLAVETPAPPPRGTKLMADGKEVGEITSAVWSPQYGVAALAYVRVPHTEPGAVLDTGDLRARVT